MSDGPKSALELAMERLRKKDAESGVVEQKLTDAQKAAIAEARSVHEAPGAQRQILHREKQLRPYEPADIATMEEEYRRDMERFAHDRDAKIRKIRGEGAEGDESRWSPRRAAWLRRSSRRRTARSRGLSKKA